MDLPMHWNDSGLTDLVMLCPPTDCPALEIHIFPPEVQDTAESTSRTPRQDDHDAKVWMNFSAALNMASPAESCWLRPWLWQPRPPAARSRTDGCDPG